MVPVPIIAMEFALPPRQTFNTSRGFEYSFIHIPARGKEETLLLLHGWPSHIDDWIHQIRHFESAGYGLLVPDTLGSGDSSSPSNPAEYRLQAIGQDLAELLDHVEQPRVVGIGHDLGATILSRMVTYYPDRFLAAAFLGIGPPSPGTPLDLDFINTMTKKANGIEMLGYIAYITRDSQAQQMMEKNAESVMDVMFAANARTWDVHFHPIDGFKNFVEGNKRQKVAEWFPSLLQNRHIEIFGRKNGHLGSIGYYRMIADNLSIPDEEAFKDYKISLPTIMVVPRDPASAAQMQRQMLSSWATDLTVTEVDAGHWVHMERSVETNRAIEDLLQRL